MRPSDLCTDDLSDANICLASSTEAVTLEEVALSSHEESVAFHSGSIVKEWECLLDEGCSVNMSDAEFSHPDVANAILLSKCDRVVDVLLERIFTRDIF